MYIFLYAKFPKELAKNTNQEENRHLIIWSNIPNGKYVNIIQGIEDIFSDLHRVFCLFVDNSQEHWKHLCYLRTFKDCTKQGLQLDSINVWWQFPSIFYALQGATFRGNLVWYTEEFKLCYIHFSEVCFSVTKLYAFCRKNSPLLDLLFALHKSLLNDILFREIFLNHLLWTYLGSSTHLPPYLLHALN